MGIPDKAFTEEAFAAAGMPEGSGEEYLQRVGDFVAAALDPLGIDVQVDVETPGGQRNTSRTRLLVLKQQRRGLPLHLTMRNGLYSLTRNPRLRPFRFRSRCWTRR